jgi:hypothetical protein
MVAAFALTAAAAMKQGIELFNISFLLVNQVDLDGPQVLGAMRLR